MGAVTIPDSGYVTFGTDINNILFATVSRWSNATGVFSMIGYGKAAYVIGDIGTVITGLKIRCWYR